MRLTRAATVFAALLVVSFVSRAHSQALRPNGFGTDALKPVEEGDETFRSRERESCRGIFRKLDGTCTNPFIKVWGSTGLPQYSYAILRSAREPTGKNLPSPRLISNIMCAQPGSILSRRRLSEFTTFVGQFIDHTIIATPENPSDNMPIEIPKDDAIFANFSKGVLSFHRSVRATLSGTSDMERPINSLPSAIDLASVYGPTETRLKAMRTFKDGLMLTSGDNMLPLNTLGLVNSPTKDDRFFLAGDHRANENPTLTSLHTIFVREHNLIARQLKERFPEYDDERLFQYAKIVNTAQFQKIVFEEYFPAMTGRSLPRYTGFKSWVNPTASDIFTGMAFRVGHTMVSNKISRRGPGNVKIPDIPSTTMFFRTAKILDQGIDVFLRGAMYERSQEIDIFIVDALRNFLFTNVPQEGGFDLIALNIQRSRDHALPSYNEIRRIFRLRPARLFRHITRNRAVQSALQTAYGSVDRIEGFVGLLSEDHVRGASMGRTMLRIWKKEFERYRDGDVFYFRNMQKYPKELLDKFPRLTDMLNERETMKGVILRNTNITAAECPGQVWKSQA